jgi:hypothetical protein
MFQVRTCSSAVHFDASETMRNSPPCLTHALITDDCDVARNAPPADATTATAAAAAAAKTHTRMLLLSVGSNRW